MENMEKEEMIQEESNVSTEAFDQVDQDVVIKTYDDSKASKIDKFFGITKFGSSMKIEIMAGLVTFLAMCYILTVNPNYILWGGKLTEAGPTYNPTDNILWASIFIATAIGAVLGTLLMALVAKMPFAQAPGLGLNSCVGSLIGGGVGFYAASYGNYAFSYGNAMLLVLISGIVFLILSVVPIGKNRKTGKFVTLREKIFDGMPVTIRKAISVGIGLFIAFIGLQNAHVIVSDKHTIVSLIDFTDKINWQAFGGTAIVDEMPVTTGLARAAVVALFGFVVIGVLSHFKVKGAVILGILAATLLAWPLGVTSLDVLAGKTNGITWKFWENFSNFFKSTSEGGVAFAAFREGFDFPANSAMTCVMVVVTFCMIDMFDTMGTVVGCATNAKLIDEDGKPHNYNKIMISDSVATVAGACLGTSTVTTFVESGAGIAAGGKTGMSSLVTACLFLLAIFLLPLFAFIPSAAAASALMYVGVLMMANVIHIDFKNPLNAIPAFVTIIMMPLAYSITTGIGMGIIVYVVLNAIAWAFDMILFAAGKKKEKPKWNISIVCAVVFALFLVYFLVPTSF